MANFNREVFTKLIHLADFGQFGGEDNKGLYLYANDKSDKFKLLLSCVRISNVPEKDHLAVTAYLMDRCHNGGNPGGMADFFEKFRNEVKQSAAGHQSFQLEKSETFLALKWRVPIWMLVCFRYHEVIDYFYGHMKEVTLGKYNLAIMLIDEVNNQ